jgi:hypothetical protein
MKPNSQADAQRPELSVGQLAARSGVAVSNIPDTESDTVKQTDGRGSV